jgi:hypothetical protein
MQLKYAYKKGEQFYIGWLADYPEHPTQGADISELEENLREIYSWIMDGTLEVKQKYNTLEIAV